MSDGRWWVAGAVVAAAALSSVARRGSSARLIPSRAKFQKGQRVYVRPNDFKKKGFYGVVWNATDRGGIHISLLPEEREENGPWARESSVGEWMYLVGKSERSGALWYQDTELRAVKSRAKGGSSARLLPGPMEAESRRWRGLPDEVVIESLDEFDEEEGGALYWSNEFGWASKASATVFRKWELESGAGPLGRWRVVAALGVRGSSSRLSSRSNEVDLVEVYHGTDADSAAQIARDGFLPGWGDAGYGVYFYDNLSSAERYVSRGGWDRSLVGGVVVSALLPRRLLQRVVPHPDWPNPGSYATVLWVPMDEDSESSLRPVAISVVK